MAARVPAPDPDLATPVDALPGIGPARADALASVGLRTVRDLVLHVPRQHRPRFEAVPIANLAVGEAAAIEGEITALRGWRRGRRAVARLVVKDATGELDVLFFNQPHVHHAFKRGERCFFQGKVGERDGRRSLTVEHYEKEGAATSARIPIYELPDGVPPRLFKRIVRPLIERLALHLDDWRAAAGLAANGLPSIAETVAALHAPRDDAQFEAARRRLAYEELIRLVMPLTQERARRYRVSKPRPTRPTRPELETVTSALPFSQTAAQRRAIAEIAGDLARPSPMHRLLHGDVGSGKTAVALVALALVARAGSQGALLAPTDLLARQHARSAAPFFGSLGVEAHVLSRATRGPERRAIRERLRSGAPCVVLGTHALLPRSVEIPRLTLAVVDEQHRFGVSQRARLRSKATDVDLLVMTATPIPRSLSMTLYGDLDLSVLDELPPGRKPIVTRRVGRDDLKDVADAARAEVARGGRVYFVCPFVSASAERDVAAAEQFVDRLRRYYRDRPLVAIAHGRRSSEQNRAALDDFASGLRPVLVSTVVIEVGVDVPQATMMVVLDAHRFGLATLHQLRGRVGRGDRPSSCVLVCGTGAEDATRRLDVLVEESDGFRIAEEDLRFRGAGQLFGTRQHGAFDLVYADLVQDFALLARARADASQLVEAAQEGLIGSLPLHSTGVSIGAVRGGAVGPG